MRRLFPLNPIAAEFGSNYDVLLTITAEMSEVEKKIADEVRQQYACEIDVDSEKGASADARTSRG